VLDWQTGLITYLLPLVLLTLLVGQIARGARGGGTGGWTRIAACALLACVAGGSSETYAAAQVTAFGLACLLCWLIGAGSGRRYVQAMLVAALAGAGLALAAIAVAPGTGERLGQSAGIGFGLAIARALQFTPGWLRLTFARPHAIELALLVGSVGVIALGTPRQSSGARLSWAPLASGGAALALVLLACMAPAFSALGSDPPGRAQLIPQYVLVCGLALLAWLAGASAGDRGLVLVRQAAVRWSTGLGLVALLSLGPLATTARVARQLGTDRAYAAASDAVEDRIRAERANGRLDVSVPRLESTGVVKNLEFVGPDREDWFNACVARYYGVRSIASE
jgi:hypothetical protein